MLKIGFDSLLFPTAYEFLRRERPLGVAATFQGSPPTTLLKIAGTVSDIFCLQTYVILYIFLHFSFNRIHTIYLIKSVKGKSFKFSLYSIQ